MASMCPDDIKTATLSGGLYDYTFENVYDITINTMGPGGGVQVSFISANGLMKKSSDSPTFDQEPKKGKKKVGKDKVNGVKTRKDTFPRTGGYPVLASVPGYSKIPFTKGTLTLIAQSPDGQLHYAKTIEEKKEFAFSNFDWILVSWPGSYSQDIFIVDDMKAFRKALGFNKKSTAVLVDEDGEEWI